VPSRSPDSWPSLDGFPRCSSHCGESRASFRSKAARHSALSQKGRAAGGVTGDSPGANRANDAGRHLRSSQNCRDTLTGVARPH
jgi:hypothetical protein